MTKNNGGDFEQTIGAGAVFLAIPLMIVVVMAMIAMLFRAIEPVIPLLAMTGAVLLAGYLYYRYRTSPFTIRGEQEREIEALVQSAEAQQRKLPREIDTGSLLLDLKDRGLPLPSLPLPLIVERANTIYTEEFLRTLPPRPPVPLEAERIYEVDYDRRTLRKGEEPPYRLRTDSKGRPTTLELEEFKAWLARFVASTVHSETTARFFADRYSDFVATLFAGLPSADGDTVGAFTLSLVDLAPAAKAAMTNAIGVLMQPSVREWHHFHSVRENFLRNRAKISESLLRERDVAAGKVVNPEQFPGTAREAVAAYFADSTLLPLLLAEVPFGLPKAKRFEGHWVVARSGGGKTNALECLINEDLAAVAAGKASVLVMDSQGTTPDTLLGRLATLKTFAPGGALEGKLIYLEPDLDYPLALNIFDIGLNRMGRLTEAQREDIVSSACEVVEFLFTGLLGGELSDNMTMVYRYLVPAMLAIPNADMTTFIELLDTDGGGKDRRVPAGFEKYRPYLKGVEPHIRSFLETDFLNDPELIKTKSAVRRRLRAALADTRFSRMFTQPRNKLDLFTELQSAKVILVNTFPARQYVEQFGRLILALLMQATQQRLEIDREQRMPTFVYVDECQDYIASEERIAKYIDKCRKQAVALVLAHQRLSNIENLRVRNALSSMAIKFSGGSDADPEELAGHVMSTADHIRHLPRGRFAAYVSGITPQAVDLGFPKSPLDDAPRISRDAFDDLRRSMRTKYGTRHRRAETPAERPPPRVATEPDSTASPAPVRAPEPLQALGEDAPEPPSPDDYDPLA